MNYTLSELPNAILSVVAAKTDELLPIRDVFYDVQKVCPELRDDSRRNVGTFLSYARDILQLLFPGLKYALLRSGFRKDL